MEENKSLENNSTTEENNSVENNSTSEENNSVEGNSTSEESNSVENNTSTDAGEANSVDNVAESTENTPTSEVENAPVKAKNTEQSQEDAHPEKSKSLHQQLLESGVHFGHQKKKWNPKMLPYIFTEKNGIHIIDLNKTIDGLQDAASALKSIARNGKKVMFVATKKQAKAIVAEAAEKANMPFVTERWLGGMLTNFPTIRKSVKKMHHIDKMLSDGSLDNLTKRERLSLTRSRNKMETVLGGISKMNRTPVALFIVDISHEHIALKEARKLGITTFALVDTNSNPNLVDFPIPGNDDATKSISIITNYLSSAIIEGQEERAHNKELEDSEDQDDGQSEGSMRHLEISEDDEIDQVAKAANHKKGARRRIPGNGTAGQGGHKPASGNNDGAAKK